MSLSNAPLGQSVSYPAQYDPGLLFPIPRAHNRASLNVSDTLPFTGADIWNAYELSWLNPKGKPQVALARFGFPASSTHIIESKSFKLYLNSFNQTPMHDSDAVRACMQQDLSAAAGGPVEVTLFAPTNFADQTLGELEGTLLDTLDI